MEGEVVERERGTDDGHREGGVRKAIPAVAGPVGIHARHRAAAVRHEHGLPVRRVLGDHEGGGTLRLYIRLLHFRIYAHQVRSGQVRSRTGWRGLSHR